MRAFLLSCALLALCGCAAGQYMPDIPNANQCMAPTDREAKITKKVWM